MNRSEPPGKVIRRLQRRFAQDEDEVRLRAGLDELHAVLAAEIRDILTRDQAESVQLAAREAQAATPEGPGLRHHSLVEARRRGIDLNQLRSAQRSVAGTGPSDNVPWRPAGDVFVAVGGDPRASGGCSPTETLVAASGPDARVTLAAIIVGRGRLRRRRAFNTVGGAGRIGTDGSLMGVVRPIRTAASAR